MDKRKEISDVVISELLVETRRRCCLCFYLDNDTARKKVQIAHIDQNRSNNQKSNLVPLCLDHHDEYDSATSQSKGITKKELEKYKEKLIGHFRKSDEVFSEKISIGERKVPDLSTGLFYNYWRLFYQVNKIIYDYDPIGLVCRGSDSNPPEDEYEVEVHEIIGRLQNNDQCLTTEKICVLVFERWFDMDITKFLKSCGQMIEEVDACWDEFKKKNYVYNGESKDEVYKMVLQQGEQLECTETVIT